MNVKFMKEVLGGDLGQTTKMPGKSFGLDTAQCGVGTKLQGVCGSVCEGCYARRLENFRPSVKKGHENRTDAVLNAMDDWLLRTDWINAMTALIQRRYEGASERYFRWHDSGDIQSYNHLTMLVQVARNIPDIQFWIPTKEKSIVLHYLRKHGEFPKNLVVRVSSAMIDAPPMRGFTLTSTVHKNEEPVGHVCPAPQQNGECGKCRACWSHEVSNVSYHKH